MDDWYTQDNKGRPLPSAVNGWGSGAKRKRSYADVKRDAQNRKNLKPPCCDGKLMPEPPCDKFYQNSTKSQRSANVAKWDKESRRGDGLFTKRRAIGAKAGNEVMHLTPKGAAMGCPTGKGNLQVKKAPALCTACQKLDDEFGLLTNAPGRFDP